MSYFPDHTLASKGLAAGFGVVSYGVRSQVIGSIPEIWWGVLAKIGIKRSEGTK